jgi:uncharacterized protein (DUF1697 family)
VPGPGTFVALLRGINVGKAKRVSMEELRRVVAGLGYGDVRTLLNSGNVVFTSPRPLVKDAASRMEKAIADGTSVAARVTLLSAEELREAVEACPLTKQATNPSRLLISVPSSAAELERLRPLAKKRWSPEAFALGARVVYLWCPDGILESPVGVAVAKELRDGVTARNYATMTKLVAVAAATGRPSG